MITVIGSSNIDFVIKTKRLPCIGETVIGGEFVMAAGGKGANQAVQIARLGAKAAFITRLGNDTLGKELLSNFKKSRLSAQYVAIDRTASTGAAFIFVDEKGRNIISVASGANARLNVKQVEAASSLIKRSRVLLLQLEVPLEAVSRAVDIAHKAGVKVILNPAPARKLSKALLSKVDVLVPNEVEASSLTGVGVVDLKTASSAAKKLLHAGVSSVIITRGSEGAFVAFGYSFFNIPAPKVKVVDTTAAGDSFCGALAVAVSENRNLADAVKFANKAASLSVTKLGAQPSLPTKKELLSRGGAAW